MPWVPIGHRVLVKPMSVKEDLEKQYKGIIIPDAIAEREQYAWNRGELIDWGPTAGFHFDGKTMDGLGCKRGDKVLYNQHAGITFKDENGDAFRVINDEDLNMRWEEPEGLISKITPENLHGEFVASEEANSG